VADLHQQGEILNLNQNQNQVEPRSISRRRVLQLLMLGTGLTAGSSLLAACGTAGPPAAAGPTSAAGATTPAQSGAAPAKPAGGPTKGGTLTVGIYQEPPTLDPHVSGSATAGRVMRHIFDSLVYQPEPGRFEAGLATAWETPDAGKTWTFKLRQGAVFHDGTPFNAQAVKFSFDRIADPKTKSLSAIGQLGPYASTEVIDDYTVKVTFKRPHVSFLNNVSSSNLAPVSPTAAAKFGEDFGRNPVGTGPFKFKEWVAASHFTIERNDVYTWAPGFLGRSGPALLDAVQLKFLLEPATRTGALQKGEVMLIDQTPDQDVAALKADSKYRVDTIEQVGSPQVLPIHASRAPTDDLAVRQALIYALDRQAMTNAVFAGVRPVAYGPLTPKTWSYLKDVEKMYPYSRDKARELLDAAGWKLNAQTNIREKDGKPLGVRYVTTDEAGNKRPAEFAQAAWKQIGVDVNLEAMAYEATAPIMLRGEHNIARIGYNATDPEFLYTLYHSDNIPGTNFNRTMTKFAELDKLIEDMNAESDQPKRQSLSESAQRFIMDNALIVPLYIVVFVYTVASQVQDVKYDLGASPYYYNIWLAKP
jgi:peptide/nickel transport system substrate-binding protein